MYERKSRPCAGGRVRRFGRRRAWFRSVLAVVGLVLAAAFPQ